jgi:hypothetical protein
MDKTEGVGGNGGGAGGDINKSNHSRILEKMKPPAHSPRHGADSIRADLDYKDEVGSGGNTNGVRKDTSYRRSEEFEDNFLSSYSSHPVNNNNNNNNNNRKDHHHRENSSSTPPPDDFNISAAENQDNKFAAKLITVKSKRNFDNNNSGVNSTANESKYSHDDDDGDDVDFSTHK